MTIQMTIALAIVVLMIVMIMSDKFSFGAPPLVACCLMVLTGVSTIAVSYTHLDVYKRQGLYNPTAAQSR